MKKLLALMLIFSMFFVIGCSEDDVDEFDTLVTYLEGESSDYGQWVNSLDGWIKTYASVEATLGDYYILDIRSATDFGVFALPNAKNSPLTDILTAVEDAGKPILVVCYSGQTSAYAHTILRLKNIEAYSLKWGMSGVPGGTDKWSGNTSNDYAEHANWSTAASGTLPSFDYPTLDTGEEDAEDILDAQIETVLADWGSALVPAGTVMANPDNYNIMNYWAVGDWNQYGHVSGAYQLTPYTLTQDVNLSVFDPDGNNVLYCWTGQTAAATISYLKVVGYDVQSISFGVNSMIYDELEGHKWTPPAGAQQ